MDRVLALQTLGEFSEPAPACGASGGSNVCSTSSTGYLVSTCSVLCEGANELDW
ncbi:MAG TPA: hypothetical protein VFO63_01425 [Blastocatellia bacterium]|jgi:hypothetical protein|nr:hypothetical protein [Blastocatellia bacterium]